MRVAFVGTELAKLAPESGALERAVIAWSASLAGSETVALFDAIPSGPDPAELAAFRPDLVVLNNRPQWVSAVPAEVPVLHVLHNYEDGWSTEPLARESFGRALSGRRSRVSAVSRALAAHVTRTFSLPEPVSEVKVPVERCFLSARWHGEGGPVLFPNRLLEKKGVRFFLELASALVGRGLACQVFRHTAPFAEPTPEQLDLIELVRSDPNVELLDPPGSRDEMAAAYASAGVVVCPSTRPEGLGLVALEAQAVGAPLVTSGLGGLSEITYPPNEVAPLDAPSWEKAVLRALEGPPGHEPSERVAAERSCERAEVSLRAAMCPLTRPADGSSP